MNLTLATLTTLIGVYLVVDALHLTATVFELVLLALGVLLVNVAPLLLVVPPEVDDE